jgi:CelD/BcsL family acetyltransferase involved in cellulose biosynthesis/glycosyltransferase involved in cell wall biosynthesis
MPLVVLSVAYPFAPVGPDAVGGAEQILTALDEALVEAGHRSLVLACEGSRCRGQLTAVPLPGGTLTPEVRRAVHAVYRATLQRTLASEPVDLLHFHGVDFPAYQPAAGPPALCTLHLPPTWYPPAVFSRRPTTFLHCVSASQRRQCPPGAALLDDIPNGVDLSRFHPAQKGPERYAVVLGRICPEKGIHLALAAARRAGIGLCIAGRVFPYPEHERYFAQEIAPRLDATRRFLGPVGMAEKPALLAGARCLLVPSLVEETSSLVAMEALASGTPVVALRRGALPEIIAPGRTGILVDSAEEMARAIELAPRLDGADCRAEAERRFSLRQMCHRYLATYERLVRGAAGARRQSDRPAPARDERRAGQRSRPAAALDELRATAALAALRDEWQELWERSAAATVFQSPAWIESWCAHLLRGELRVLTYRRRGRLAGIAPFFTWGERGSRVLSLLGAGISDYLDLLLDDAAADEALRAIAAWLADTRNQWSRIEWSELRDDAALLRLRPPADWQVADASQDPCPGLLLAGSAGPLDCVPARMRSRVQYARRRAARDTGLEIEPAGRDNLDALLTALERLHTARWRLRGEDGVLDAPRVRAFHREVARKLLDADRLMLHGVKLGGEMAGVLYGFHDKQATRYYVSGFDPRFARSSPGMLAVAQSIEAAAARGSRVFDFLRGAEPYKYRWGATDLCTLHRRVIHGGNAARPELPEVAAHGDGRLRRGTGAYMWRTGKL